MNAVPLTHPSPERLAAFVSGKLGEAESAEIETHLADCDTCRAVLELLPDDTVVSLLRAPATAPAPRRPRRSRARR